jgi:hypothetical protein
MYENKKMRPVETIPGMRKEEERRMMEEVNPTIICCKNFCKSHNILSVQQYDNKKAFPPQEKDLLNDQYVQDTLYMVVQNSSF